MFENRRLERKLDRIEFKLDAIMRHLEITDSPARTIDSPTRPMGEGGFGMAEVDELLAQGKKIAAIKRYRELHPATSLKQAKDAVEARARPYY